MVVVVVEVAGHHLPRIEPGKPIAHACLKRGEIGGRAASPNLKPTGRRAYGVGNPPRKRRRQSWLCGGCSVSLSSPKLEALVSASGSREILRHLSSSLRLLRLFLSSPTSTWRYSSHVAFARWALSLAGFPPSDSCSTPMYSKVEAVLRVRLLVSDHLHLEALLKSGTSNQILDPSPGWQVDSSSTPPVSSHINTRKATQCLGGYNIKACR